MNPSSTVPFKTRTQGSIPHKTQGSIPHSTTAASARTHLTDMVGRGSHRALFSGKTAWRTISPKPGSSPGERCPPRARTALTGPPLANPHCPHWAPVAGPRKAWVLLYMRSTPSGDSTTTACTGALVLGWLLLRNPGVSLRAPSWESVDGAPRPRLASCSFCRVVQEGLGARAPPVQARQQRPTCTFDAR